MAVLLHALSFDAHDPGGLATFWAGLLGWDRAKEAGGGVTLVPRDDTGFRLRFLQSGQEKAGPNQIHFDLTSSSVQDQQDMVARALDLGGRHVDVGQLPEERHVVLGDPEGNEFCVIEPDNQFLADCGRIGALSCDGTQAVGYFWSRALDWPLVWDQDQETAIRSPHGGPMITWGGPPVAPKHGRNRLHLDLVPSPGSDQQGEVDRLLSLGATRTDTGHGAGAVALADPDGNELCVLPAQ